MKEKLRNIINSRSFRIMAALESNRNKDTVTLAKEILRNQRKPNNVTIVEPSVRTKKSKKSKTDRKRHGHSKLKTGNQPKMACRQPSPQQQPISNAIPQQQPISHSSDTHHQLIQYTNSSYKSHVNEEIPPDTFYGLEKESPESPPPAPQCIIKSEIKLEEVKKVKKCRKLVPFHTRKSRFESNFPQIRTEEVLTFYLEKLLSQIKNKLSHTTKTKPFDASTQIAP